MMATTTNSLHHHLLDPHHHHHTMHSPFKPTILLLKPTTPFPSTTAFSLSSSTPASVSSVPSAATASTAAITFDTLQGHLSTQNFRQADEETRRLLIVLAGEAAQKRGYVFFSEVQFISESDLKAIDSLWRTHSNNRFGYSVQRKIWRKVNKDFTKLFLKVGWMKKLDTEVEQYNYRAFPDEFVWELTDDTPEGHLPLTNALRGTQLLNCILGHPAFEAEDDQEEEERVGISDGKAGEEENNGSVEQQAKKKRVLKTDYSF